MNKIQLIIPFRDRGTDLRRGANLEVVIAWWWAHGLDAAVVDDGLSGSAQFNRHAAYNRAVDQFSDAEVFIFSEADMLVPFEQIAEAVSRARGWTGLVVPFSTYRYLSDEATTVVRDQYADLEPDQLAKWWDLPVTDEASLWRMPAQSMMSENKSIGAVNVVSRETLEITGGFTEATAGNWYDDNITEEGFAYLTGHPTRFVPGPAVHLYHLPGFTGDHLTEEDRAATQHNKDLLRMMRHNIRKRNRRAVHDLMSYRMSVNPNG